MEQGYGVHRTILMPDDLPILYVKAGCPWCFEAISFLDGHGIEYRQVDVLADRSAAAELRKKSNQDKTPTLDWHGDILSDFGVDELKDFLHAHDVVLDDS
jgi:glutaredoxin 3